MVIYDLICDLRHQFEGWFSNSDDFAAQQKNAMLSCPVCGSLDIIKKVATPKVGRKSNSTAAGSNEMVKSSSQILDSVNPDESERYNKMQNTLLKMHDFIDSNFEDVGNKFASEALSMHKGEKEVGNIRGTASADELKELTEEGVNALPLPAKPIDKKKLN